MVLRVPSVEAVDGYAQALLEKYPRSTLPELQAHPMNDQDFFREWAQQSLQVAVDWAFNLEMAADNLEAQRQFLGR